MEKETGKKRVILKKMTENIAAIIDSDMCIVYNESFVNLIYRTSDRVIDPGTSFYDTTYHDYFRSYSNGDYGHVRIENNGI